MLELIPTMMQSDNKEALTELVKKQTETQWENFFNAINNSDLRDAFLVKIGTTVEYLYSGILMDDMKMMTANAFLLTQNLLRPENSFDQKDSWTKQLFRPKSFLDQKIFSTKEFFDEKSFLTINFF